MDSCGSQPAIVKTILRANRVVGHPAWPPDAQLLDKAIHRTSTALGPLDLPCALRNQSIEYAYPSGYRTVVEVRAGRFEPRFMLSQDGQLESVRRQT